MNRTKSKLWLLIKIQLLSYFGINKALHAGGNAKSKLTGKALLSVVVVVYFVWLSYFYNSQLGNALFQLGLGTHLLPVVMFVGSSVLSLVYGIIQSGKALFTFKSYDQIMSMPVSPAAVAGSRIAVLYSFDLLVAALFLIPSAVVYAQYNSISVLFIVIYALCLIAVPVLPLVISAIIGTAVTAVSSRMRAFGKLISALLCFAFVAVCFIAPSFLSGERGTNLLENLETTIYSSWLPAKLFAKAIEGPSIGYALVFVLGSFAIYALFCFCVAVPYRKLCSRVSTMASVTRRSKSSVIASAGSPLSALYRRELKRYFSSTLYVTNTMMGMVIAIIACVVMVAKGGLTGLFGDQSVESLNAMGFNNVVPIVLGALVCMSCTTGSSISLEGSALWIVKSMPVKAWTIFLAKIMVNLTVTVPLTLICAVMAAFSMEASTYLWIMMIVTPMIYALFSAIFGVYINLLIPKLDWDNETQVIKQSMASMISMLGSGMLAVLLCIAAVFFRSALLAALTSAVPLIVGAVIAVILMSRGDRMLSRLG